MKHFALLVIGLTLAGCGAVAAYEQAQRLNREIEELSQAGRVAEALPLAERTLAEMQTALGPEHPEVIGTLTNVALLNQSLGHYARAGELHRRVLTIRRKAHGAVHPEVATALAHLVDFHRVQRQYAEATALQREVVTIREKTVGASDLEVAVAISQLADLYRAQAQYREAEPLYLRALAIREKQQGQDSLDVASSLGDLADLYAAQGAPGRAAPLQRRALAIFERSLGPDDPLMAILLNGLASRYHAHRQYDEAEQLYRRALAILRTSAGDDHPDVANALGNLAALHWAAGDVPRALEAQAQAVDARERALALILDTGSEEQKRVHAAALETETQTTVSLHVDALPDDPAALRLALTTVLRRKGRVLDVMAHNLNAARRALPPADQGLFEQWTRARTRYAELVLRGVDPLAPDLSRARLAEVAGEVERLEAEIAARNPEFRAHTEAATLEAIQRTLPPDAALVEFVQVPRFDPRGATPAERWGATRYVAYVVVRDAAPRWVLLGDAEAVDWDVTLLRDQLSDPRRGAVTDMARTLDERVMRPIRALAGERRLLLLSPDGALNLVPFAALVDETGHHLVERYTIAYVTSGRDLLREKHDGGPGRGSVVVANPDYGAHVAAVAARPATAGVRGTRGETLAATRWEPLPGTADEARALGTLLPTASVLVGADATEAAIKRVQRPLILHVATHGFFMTEAAAGEPAPAARGATRGRTLTRAAERPGGDRLPDNPLLRSGLALAGANALRSGAEDGVLTALEAAALDLNGTKLVVLSACETGVGTVRGSEGVYGLRRAFVMAGVESQVASLWKVDDAATRDLMVSFYRRLLAGAGRADALRDAQREFVRAGERRHPFYWASFILIGDWAPFTASR